MAEQSVVRGEVMEDPRAGEVLDIIAKETGIARDRLTPEATIEELGIPSLDVVQSIFAIETRFDVEVPVVSDRQQGAEFVTVGDILAHVMRTIEAAHPRGQAE